MKRFSVNKHGFAKKFRRNAGRTKFANVRPAPMRGGMRF